MKKYILVLSLFLVSIVVFGQSGINTNNPLQTLHITGTPSTTTAIGTTGKNLVTPTIRLEGLNQTNNSAHPASPTISNLPVYANVNGDLVLGSRTKLLNQTILNTDAVTTTSSINITGTADVVTSLKTISFTIDKPSLVFINAMVSISGIFQSGLLVAPTDGRARRMGIQFRFTTVPAASGIPLNIAIADVTNSYTNLGTNGNILSGFYLYNLGKAIKLTPGNYVLDVVGIAAANSNSFQIKYGEAPYDSVNIVALAL